MFLMGRMSFLHFSNQRYFDLHKVQSTFSRGLEVILPGMLPLQSLNAVFRIRYILKRIRIRKNWLNVKRFESLKGWLGAGEPNRRVALAPST